MKNHWESERYYLSHVEVHKLWIHVPEQKVKSYP